MSVSDELYASYENGREAGIASAREAFDAERAAYESKIIEIEARRVDDAEIIATLEAENAELMEENDRLRLALLMVATYDQDDRPEIGGEGDFAWDAPFDWRRRSMKQERIARFALAYKKPKPPQEPPRPKVPRDFA